jgi:hypothetical protein
VTDRLLARGIARARWSILWERSWPPLAAFLTVGGLFLALSWLGLWLWLPPLARAAGVVMFGLLALAALSPFAMIRMPSASEGLRRLDRESGLPHRPAITLTDRLSAHAGDAMTQALWRVHVERALAAARKLRAGWPMPRLSARDPVAIRALVLVLAVATFFVAGGDRERRVAAAFNWQGVVTPANYRVDAWVAPPPYTQRPPVILPGLRSGEAQRASAPVTVPANSILVIRASGATGLDVALRGGITADDKTDAAAQPPAAGTEERRYVITDKGEVTLRGIGDPVTWRFDAVPDRAPTIALTKDPEPQARGSLMLNYKLEDDYGVAEARALFALKPQLDEFGMKGGGFKAPRPLFDAPDMPLVLPQARTRNGVGQTLRDLSSHPWAGADIALTLRAVDEGGNEGTSEPFDMRLPERLFTKPMARALIEQRRVLALDAETKPRVLTALDALAMAPEVFQIEASVYLGLRSIYWQLNRAKSDDSLRDVVARLWDMATRSRTVTFRTSKRLCARRRRRCARRSNAAPAKRKSRSSPTICAPRSTSSCRLWPRRCARIRRPLVRWIRMRATCARRICKNMIDRMEQLARSGAKDAAQRCCRNCSRCWKICRWRAPVSRAIRTRRHDVGARRTRQHDPRAAAIARSNLPPGPGSAARASARASAASRASRASKSPTPANCARISRRCAINCRSCWSSSSNAAWASRARMARTAWISSARPAKPWARPKASSATATPMARSSPRAARSKRFVAALRGWPSRCSSSQAWVRGPGQPGRNGPSRAQQETDPLGRPLRQGRDYSDDSTVKVPGEIDVQRARRILDELRRRFSDPARPQLELDYLERLLKDF